MKAKEENKMIKRLSNSLFSPRAVLNYRSDKWYITALYFLILLFISIIPPAVIAIQKDGIDYDTQKDIRLYFVGKEDIPYEINNGILIHDQANNNMIHVEQISDLYSIIFTNQEEIASNDIPTSFSIILRTDGVYIRQASYMLRFFAYSEYPELDGLDFSNASSSNSVDFWNTVFDVADAQMAKYKGFFAFVSILYFFFANAFNFLIVSLILSLFQSFTLSRILSFGKLWKCCIYMLTPFVFGTTLASLFQFNLFYYIGFFASAIYVIIMSREALIKAMKGE